jgi:hypothetical protein
VVAIYYGGLDVRQGLTRLFAAFIACACVWSGAQAARQAVPGLDLTAIDRPSDAGEVIELNWSLTFSGNATSYEVFRSISSDGPFQSLATLTKLTFLDESVEDGTDYYYKVIAELDMADAVVDSTITGSATLTSRVAGPVHSIAQWFNWSRLNTLVIGGFVAGAIVFFIGLARSGRKLFIRKIAGLEAVDDAIGRATEMGRPILFIPGIQDMDNVQTIAGLTILARVAKVAAEYETTLNVPVSRSLVMTTARETLREAFLAAGRPDAYNDEMVHYLTDEQFGYVAAVDGIMVREKPATCFYMGAFYAEALIMAETGHEIGAIQIAGTAQPAQLPFFVAACDYTLIGEELFAASAYLSNEPKQLGSLKGQDTGKALGMVAIAAATLLFTLGSLFPEAEVFNNLGNMISSAFRVR